MVTKTKMWAVLAAALLFLPMKSSAQRQFIIGLESRSGNFWSASFLGIPTVLINEGLMLLAGDDPEQGAPGIGYSYRFNRIKNNGEKVDYDGNRFFGFKAKDLFRDFEYSLKIGWQPIQVPVGFYARIGYQHENFNTRLSEADEWTKHRIDCIKPGLVLRISPLENLLEDEDGLCPIIEIGSTYDYYVGYKGAYGNDKKQLNNGVSTYLGLGWKFANGAAFVISFDQANYDLFNRDFVVDGIKPYANMTTNRYNISVSGSLGL